MRREDEARRNPSFNGARRKAPRTGIEARGRLEEEERSSPPQFPLAKAQTVLADEFEDEGIELFMAKVPPADHPATVDDDAGARDRLVPGSECTPNAGARRFPGPRQRIDKLCPDGSVIDLRAGEAPARERIQVRLPIITAADPHELEGTIPVLAQQTRVHSVSFE